MVLFKRYHIWPMHQGLKTHTRRMWKKPHVKIGKWYPVTHKMYPQPEDVVGEIYVEDVYRQPLGMMTEKDAYDEGGYTLYGYKNTLAAITKKPWDDCAVPFVVKFRFILSDIIDGNGGTSEIDQYRRLWEAHMKGIEPMKWKRIVRETGLVEWVCEHGIGHPDVASAKKMGDGWGIHGCDGCCSRADFPGNVAKDEMLKEFVERGGL